MAPRELKVQRGAAILLAMLTVTLVATFAAATLWQQWRAYEVESYERSRHQSAWILVGALDWARLILSEDGRSGGPDHLGEPWAVGLDESRLSTFLADDKATDNVEFSRDAFLSGRISDEQAKLNVMNLVQGGTLSKTAYAQFERLFVALSLPTSELNTLATQLRSATAASGATTSGGQAAGAALATGGPTALMPQRLGDLLWLGVSRSTQQRLAPFVTVLPARTPINLNTAPMEVLMASVDGLDASIAQRMIDARAQSPWSNLAALNELLGPLASHLTNEDQSIASRFFEVRGRLRIDDIVVEERSLVQRDGIDVKVLWRERSAAVTPDTSGTSATARPTSGGY